jgi:hypothetical protein
MPNQMILWLMLLLSAERIINMSFYNCTGGGKKLNLLMLNQPNQGAWSQIVAFETKGINSVTIQYWSRSGSECVRAWVSNIAPTTEWYITDSHPVPNATAFVPPLTGTTPVTYTIDCKDYDYMGLALRYEGRMTCNIVSIT